ncbi:MAG: hypothetical protein ACFB3T_05900 [Geminicoccaceae bacterium]
MFGAAQAGVLDPVPEFVCEGIDPPWRANVLGHDAWLEFQGLIDGAHYKGILNGSADGSMHVWRGRGEFTRNDAVLLVQENRCQLPGRPSPDAYSAWLSLPGGQLDQGCCRRMIPDPPLAERQTGESGQPPVATPLFRGQRPMWEFADKSADDWSRQLPALMPAVESCLAVLILRPIDVVHASEDEVGNSLIRLRRRNGHRFDCRVSAKKSKVELITPVPADTFLDGENWPVFTRDPDQPPDGKCWRREVIDLDAGGAVLGFLSYPIC